MKERLEYKLNQRRGCCFNLDDEDITINNKSDTFINSSISNNLMDVILLLTGIHYKMINTQEHTSPDSILYNLQSGEINRSEEKILDQVEKILDGIFRLFLKML